MKRQPMNAPCPHCQTPTSREDQGFCTQCGLVLHQPCPQCTAPLATPQGGFQSCAQCQTPFWSCPECGRLYHLDRTSCLNSYCPQQGIFWTSRFGSESWDWTYGLTPARTDSPLNDAVPAWVIPGNKDRRLPSLHHLGLLISVLDSGVIELWPEHGAPGLNSLADDFREDSVRLCRLDLGEPATAAPIMFLDHVIILGRCSLTILELSASPSLTGRLELPGAKGPLQAIPLDSSLVIVSSTGLWEVDPLAGHILHTQPGTWATTLAPVAGEHQVLLFDTKAMMWTYQNGGQLEQLSPSSHSSLPEWAIYAGHFLTIERNQLTSYKEGATHTRDLPAAVIARPLYDPQEERLLLLLSDSTLRSCSVNGERFSFICDVPGVPTTPPLKVGSQVFYGIDGRYLCVNQEALRPRLNSPPWGELSYANGRVFGTTRDGGLFCFYL